jgi:hypothetical protein
MRPSRKCYPVLRACNNSHYCCRLLSFFWPSLRAYVHFIMHQTAWAKVPHCIIYLVLPWDFGGSQMEGTKSLIKSLLMAPTTHMCRWYGVRPWGDLDQGRTHMCSSGACSLAGPRLGKPGHLPRLFLPHTMYWWSFLWFIKRRSIDERRWSEHWDLINRTAIQQSCCKSAWYLFWKYTTRTRCVS